jgi:hypothetical protein
VSRPGRRSSEQRNVGHDLERSAVDSATTVDDGKEVGRADRPVGAAPELVADHAALGRDDLVPIGEDVEPHVEIAITNGHDVDSIDSVGAVGRAGRRVWW